MTKSVEIGGVRRTENKITMRVRIKRKSSVCRALSREETETVCVKEKKIECNE